MASDNVASSASVNRASWDELHEFDLLDRYLAARDVRSLATDKGIKPKAWNQLVANLNAKHGRALDKGQYKSKHTRLMQDYDLYKYITNLSGAGICPDSGKPTLDDDVWERLMAAKTKQKKKIEAIRKHGFPHATLCSLIAGHTRATGSHATTVAELATALCEQENASNNEHDHDVDIGFSTAPEANTAARQHLAGVRDGPASRAMASASGEQRVERVKRIRGGALKSNRDRKKNKSDADIKKALKALIRTTTAYMKKKMDAIDKSSASSDSNNSDIDQGTTEQRFVC